MFNSISTATAESLRLETDVAIESAIAALSTVLYAGNFLPSVDVVVAYEELCFARLKMLRSEQFRRQCVAQGTGVAP